MAAPHLLIFLGDTVLRLVFALGLIQASSAEALCPSRCTCEVQGASANLECHVGWDKQQLGEYFQSIRLAVTELFFRSSGLTAVPREICSLDKLLHLDLTNNSIGRLQNQPFSCLPQIHIITLNYNSLDGIGAQDFAGLTTLETLHLEHNAIISVHPHAFTRRELSNLTNLQLAYNDMQVFDLWPMRMRAYQLNKHTLVNYTYNKMDRSSNSLNVSIKELNLSQSVTILFNFNHFRYVRYFNFLKLLSVTDADQLLRLWNCAFDFHYNPLQCDCDMYEFIKFVRPLIQHFQNLQDLYLIQVTCDERLIAYIPDDAFVCQVGQSCPPGCACNHRPGNHTVQVYCRGRDNITSLPPQLPGEKHISLDFAGTRIRELSPRSYLPNVTSLDLSVTLLEVLESEALQQIRNIRALHLHTAQLKRIPQRMMYIHFTNLSSFSLWGNPLVCDCYAVWLKHWLTDHSTVVASLGKTTCNGKPLTKHHDRHLTCGNNALLVIEAVTVFTFLLLVITALRSSAACQRSIRLRLQHFFSRRLNSGGNTELHHNGLTNDVAILYDDVYDEVLARRVERVIMRLNPAYQVQLVQRDAPYNMGDVEGCGDVIRRSRTLLILMCKHFLENKMTCYFLRGAFGIYLEDSNRELLLLLLHPHLEMVEAASNEPYIRDILQQYTYIQYRHNETALMTSMREKLRQPSGPPP